VKINPATESEFVHFGIHEIASSIAFGALTLLDGRQEGHPACKKTE